MFVGPSEHYRAVQHEREPRERRQATAGERPSRPTVRHLRSPQATTYGESEMTSSPLSTWEPLDLLLADVAIRLQLSATDHKKAVDRYEAVSTWIEREGSRLRDRVDLFYAQGSMAIGATVAARATDDEFDIDVVAQLRFPQLIQPEAPLDLLWEAIRGDRGSRYYDMAERKTRCVTVNYKDGMHLDVTPSLRIAGTPERESWIFHDRPENPAEPSTKLVANPYGFAQWFNTVTPPDTDFARFLVGRTSQYYTLLKAQRAADAEPVPPREPPLRRSDVVVLHLLKRWRNLRYARRAGRRPPSILLAKLVGDSVGAGLSLSDGLRHHARNLRDQFRVCHDRGIPIQASNPVCDRDVLTDRWPANLAEQGLFVDDLSHLVRQVERMVGGRSLDEMRAIMVGLFGEHPTNRVFEAFNQTLGDAARTGSSGYRRGLGAVAIPALGISASASAQTTPRHTFYGENSDDR